MSDTVAADAAAPAPVEATPSPAPSPSGDAPAALAAAPAVSPEEAAAAALQASTELATQAQAAMGGSHTNVGFVGEPLTKYGTHSCTCDGCVARPIVGYRYKCLKCRDHDVCEACYLSFRSGVLKHTNKNNNVPKDLASHAFAPYIDRKAFTAVAATKKGTTKVAKEKVKPNDPCSCQSGKKYKKCCWLKEGDQ